MTPQFDPLTGLPVTAAPEAGSERTEHVLDLLALGGSWQQPAYAAAITELEIPAVITLIPARSDLETIELSGAAIKEFISARGGKPGSGGGGGGTSPSLAGIFADQSHAIGNEYVAFHFNLLSNFDYTPYLEDIYNTAMFISSLMTDHGDSGTSNKEVITVDLYFEKWVGGTTLGGSYRLNDPDKDDDGLNDQAQIVLNPRYTSSMTSSGSDTFALLLIHELFHSMGFAQDNEWASLTDSINGTFTGLNAIDAFTDWSGNPLQIPYLESGGGSGTVGAHWENDSLINGEINVLAGDLMVGYLDINKPSQFLSWTTIAAMEDFGWGTLFTGSTNYSDGIAYSGEQIARYDVWPA
jgi:hypothetical protein